jgi:hypothetical protein
MNQESKAGNQKSDQRGEEVVRDERECGEGPWCPALQADGGDIGVSDGG